jgi:hypothetical protein
VTVVAYPQLTGKLESPAASAVTGSDGTYQLRSDLTTDLSDVAASHDGYVGFEVDAQTAQYTSKTFFSKRWVNGAWEQGDAMPAPATIEIDPTSGTTFQTPAADAAFFHGNSLHPNVPAPPTCHYGNDVVTGTRQQRPTVIGELHTANDAHETYVYGRNSFSESNMTVGLSANGTDWSAGASVTISIRKSSGSEVTKTVGPNVGTKLGTEFGYEEVHNFEKCTGPKHYMGYETMVTGFNGGTPIQPGYGNHDLDGHCPPVSAPSQRTQPYSSNSAAHTFNERQVTFTPGVTLGFKSASVSLNVQSGWSSNVESSWKFGSANNHYICGSDGPVFKAPRVFAGLQQ